MSSFLLRKKMDICSKIAAGKIPSDKCAESDKFYAFLDINPVAKGHVLCIPKHEVDYLFDLSDEEYASLMLFAKRVAAALKKTLPCVKVGEAVLGLEEPHAHVHLVPINKESDMNFFKEKLSLPAEEMQQIAEGIAKNF